MTIEIMVMCDGLGCSESLGYDGDISEYLISEWLERHGYHETEDGSHYCPKCWPEVRRELDEERKEAPNPRGGGASCRGS